MVPGKRVQRTSSASTSSDNGLIGKPIRIVQLEQAANDNGRWYSKGTFGRAREQAGLRALSRSEVERLNSEPTGLPSAPSRSAPTGSCSTGACSKTKAVTRDRRELAATRGVGTTKSPLPITERTPHSPNDTVLRWTRRS